MSNNQETFTGKIVGMIIMLLACFSILCDLFNIDVIGFVSLSELIKDAGMFITFICIVYIVTNFYKHAGSYKAVLIFSADIILINRLYSSAKWKMIYTYIKGVDKKRVLLIIIILATILYVIYGIISSKKSKNNILINGSNEKQGQYSNQEKEQNDNRIEKEQEKLSGDDFSGGFRISAFIAFTLVVLLFIYSKEFNFNEANGKILSAISDNMFTVVFAFIIFFMIFQIACIIILNILSGRKINNGLGYKFKTSIERVETKMVKLACNIIEGCISLLDFILDFFSTIGLLLLDQEIDLKEDDDSQNKKEKRKGDTYGKGK